MLSNRSLKSVMFLFHTSSQVYNIHPSIHPSIHHLYMLVLAGSSRVHLRVTQRHTGQTTVHATLTPKGNLDKPVNLTVMFLGCGRKLEYPERTHECTRRTCKLQARKIPGWDWTFVMQGNSANTSFTAQP
ncbi:hypothetical protein AMECASPLE_029784 [Ameca splendens]|uniref:Uncharacterized protein n=1 Tax=Ameca splendens TaxID=208324 RepID=A0ABV0XUT6_9TELE